MTCNIINKIDAPHNHVQCTLYMYFFFWVWQNIYVRKFDYLDVKYF